MSFLLSKKYIYKTVSSRFDLILAAKYTRFHKVFRLKLLSVAILSSFVYHEMLCSTSKLEWIPWWLPICTPFTFPPVVHFWSIGLSHSVIRRSDYTAEFLPMISPLRICTPLPSNSTDEFIFTPPTSGNVFNGCFSSSLFVAWWVKWVVRCSVKMSSHRRAVGKKGYMLLLIEHTIGVVKTQWNKAELDAIYKIKLKVLFLNEHAFCINICVG